MTNPTLMASGVSGWQPIDTAPRDGTWIRLRSDEERPRYAVGRWNPQHYSTTGVTYEWQVLDSTHSPELNHWADGYAYEWMPLPPPPGADA